MNLYPPPVDTGEPSHGVTPGHALGGTIPRGQFGYVHSQELVYGGVSGLSVFNPSQTRVMMSGGLRYTGGSGSGRGNTQIHHHYNIGPIYGQSADDVADKVTQKLNRELRRSGNLVTTTSGGRAPG